MLGKYDFIILYEHRARELENAVLLAMHLEKKGYKVAIEYRRSARLLFQRTDVIIVPFFYNNENVIDFTIQLFGNVKKVINLQYEQLFNSIDEESGLLYPHDYAVHASTIAWGKKECELMQKNGIPAKNIFTIGNMSIDLNYEKYKACYYSKKELADKFGIPFDKEWHLFISSFSYVGISKANIKQLSDYVYAPEQFMDLSVNSWEILMEWYERFLKEHEDTIIIYRPHPGELKNAKLSEMSKKYKNFFCLNEYSIRQWIRICDSISMWYSTSLVDIYYAGKRCGIVRPIKIPDDLDFKIYESQRIITRYEDYEQFILKDNKEYSLDAQNIQEYYENKKDEDTFKKLVDICIDIRENNTNSYDFKSVEKKQKEKSIKYFIYRVLMGGASIVNYKKIMLPKYKDDVNHTFIESKGYKREIKEYRKMFSKLI